MRTCESLCPASGKEIARRFPWLVSLDIGDSAVGAQWLPSLQSCSRLANLILGQHGRDPPPGGLALCLEGRYLNRLKVLQLTHLDLQGCYHLVDADLEPFKNMPIAHLNLGSCRKLTHGVLDCLQGMPIAQLNLTG